MNEREWTTSSFCDYGGCVEVAHVAPEIQKVQKTRWVRNTAEPTVQVGFTEEEWAAFLAGVKAGEFD